MTRSNPLLKALFAPLRAGASAPDTIDVGAFQDAAGDPLLAYHPSTRTLDVNASALTLDGAPLPAGVACQVFEVAPNLLIPEGTDFTEPMEIGRFGLTNAHVIVSGLVTMRYTAGDSYEAISIFVAPVARKTPAQSGYLHAGFWNSGSVFVPPSPPAAAEAFGSFHLQDSGPFPLKLWDSPEEQEATAPLGSDAAVDFGVYLSPLSDANPDNTTYQAITVEAASVKLLIF